jgi:hypothetical protein
LRMRSQSLSQSLITMNRSVTGTRSRTQTSSLRLTTLIIRSKLFSPFQIKARAIKAESSLRKQLTGSLYSKNKCIKLNQTSQT